MKKGLFFLGFFLTLPLMPVHAAQEEVDAALLERMRDVMIEEHLKARGIKDERVLEAIRRVPRHEFVPDQLRMQAYADSPLPIGYNQTISQPYIVAFMTEMLGVRPGDRVLEIGTGSGYQAAVLAELGVDVYSIEIVDALYYRAFQTLERLGYSNVRLRLGNGWLGWPEEAPFDKIMVTAAPDEMPPKLVEQLAEGGRIIVPVGSIFQQLVIGVKENGDFRETETIPVRFVPLVEKPQE